MDYLERLLLQNGQVQLNYNDRFGNLDFGVSLKSVYEENRVTGLSASL